MQTADVVHNEAETRYELHKNGVEIGIAGVARIAL